MKKRVGVVMDPIASINYKKDSTLAMLWAAADRDWQLYYMEQGDLYLEEGIAKATMTPLRVFRDSQNWFRLGTPERCRLDMLDAILMRKDPPFNNEYIYSTYILEAAQQNGTLVVNDPQSLRDCNEKMFATQFPQCCPPLLVSRNQEQLREFHAKQRDVVFKPLDGMGGSLVFRVRTGDQNLNVILETLTNHGATTIMAQRYLPEIADGDKRILMIDGQPIDYALARIPSAGEGRGNLAAGGRGEARPLTERDRWICMEVAESLLERNLIFVGLDVIGDYLTEINVTSPTCIREIDNAYNIGIADCLMDCIEHRLEQ